MVELSTRQRKLTGNGGNDHSKLGLRRISCASQLSIPDTTGTSPDQQCNITHMRSSEPNHAVCTPDSSYLLESSTSFSSSSPISVFCVHNPTIIAEHKVKSSFSISPCHDHELTASAACTNYSIHREYRIHRVQHPPRIVCHPFNFMIES